MARAKDGAIHAFSSVCRHRGMEVTEGEGTCTTFTCPYHHWVYGLDGRLLGAPAMERTHDFDKKDWGLPNLAVEVWQGFVFVNLDRDAAPLAPTLARYEPFLEHYHLADCVCPGTFTLTDLPWNWKVMFENFNDGYHANRLHQVIQDFCPSRLAAFPVPWDDASNVVFRTNGYTHIDGGFNATTKALLPVFPDLTEEERWRSTFALVPPTLCLGTAPDQAFFFIVTPQTAGTIDVEIGYLLHPSAARAPDVRPPVRDVRRRRPGVRPPGPGRHDQGPAGHGQPVRRRAAATPGRRRATSSSTAGSCSATGSTTRSTTPPQHHPTEGETHEKEDDGDRRARGARASWPRRAAATRTAAATPRPGGAATTAAAAGGASTEAPTTEATATTAAAGASADALATLDKNGDGKVVFGVATPGPRDDGAYYQALVDGVTKFSEDNGFETPVVVDNIPAADAATQLENLARQNVDAVMVGAGEISDPLNSLIPKYPNLLWYCNCGAGYQDQTKLLIQSNDDSSEISYSAGYATGLLMKAAGQTKAAFIGNNNFNFEQEAFQAFELGLHAVDPSFEWTYVGTGSFDDVAAATEAFNNLYAQGVAGGVPVPGRRPRGRGEAGQREGRRHRHERRLLEGLRPDRPEVRPHGQVRRR